MILLGQSLPGMHVLAPKPFMQATGQPVPDNIGQLHQGVASLQQRVEALAQALVAHGIDF